MMSILSATLQTARATSVRIASPRRKLLHDMPPQLYDYWARTAHHEFQGIPRDAFFYARAADALLTFFQCIARSNRPCALPSKAADSVWHAWLRWSPASLDTFCERHFGRRIPHIEAADMSGGMALPLAVCLVTARRLDRQPPAGPHVPRLFATDRALRMPGGTAWQVQRDRMVCAPMNAHGGPADAPQVHSATEPHFLLATGLISQEDFARSRSPHKSDGDCGAGDFRGEDTCEVGGESAGDSGYGGDCGGGCGGGD